MKTSTIMWTLAVLIILIGGGAYYYSNSMGAVPAASDTSAEIPNPSGTNLPAGDMAPTPSTPIASSTTSASTTIKVQ